jgi:hypothetical protein
MTRISITCIVRKRKGWKEKPTDLKSLKYFDGQD